MMDQVLIELSRSVFIKPAKLKGQLTVLRGERPTHCLMIPPPQRPIRPCERILNRKPLPHTLGQRNPTQRGIIRHAPHNLLCLIDGEPGRRDLPTCQFMPWSTKGYELRFQGQSGNLWVAERWEDVFVCG